MSKLSKQNKGGRVLIRVLGSKPKPGSNTRSVRDRDLHADDGNLNQKEVVK